MLHICRSRSRHCHYAAAGASGWRGPGVVASASPSTQINSSKSMIGHLMGAAGAVEAVACVQALRTGWLHPNLNLENPEVRSMSCRCSRVPRAAQDGRQLAQIGSWGMRGAVGRAVRRVCARLAGQEAAERRLCRT